MGVSIGVLLYPTRDCLNDDWIFHKLKVKHICFGAMSEISLCLRNPMGGDNSCTTSDRQAELWSTFDAILCDISHMIHMIEVGEIANKQACPSISEWIKESVLLRQNAVLAQDTSLIFKNLGMDFWIFVLVNPSHIFKGQV